MKRIIIILYAPIVFLLDYVKELVKQPKTL